MTSPLSHCANVNLPESLESLLQGFLEAAKSSFGEDLTSILLFGSGAEGKLRPSSDLNLLIVLKRFDKAKVDEFREPWRAARVAGQISAMFVLESELPSAAEAFAVKFDDIARRKRVLFGPDLIEGLTTSRAAKIQRLRQILMNFILRTRERYASLSLREEQLAGVVANAAGPLRSAAATLLELEGAPAAASPKEALEKLSSALGDQRWSSSLEALSAARNSGALPAGAAAQTVFDLMDLAQALHRRSFSLS
jgi:predicted nucleotidyltransferase